ncbi:Imm2 family immunity protein [Delftia tsuruhatensis]|uniref:Imm2 family immunity protein n=1 Tax=Delftia tsuruhatensis TaxID=180282 RepID=UPI001EF49489|nr:Imm2 family immunity protein [Delftia tsuruhatensis]
MTECLNYGAKERLSYGEMRNYFLSCYYEYCRLKLRDCNEWVAGESEAGYAYGEFENSFEIPIEKLMLEVLALIMLAGRSSEEIKNFHLNSIANILKSMDLASVLQELPADEKDELVTDLKILGLF